MSKRNTVQKLLIHDAVMAMGNHPTADEIYYKVADLCPNISKGTVYRNLNQLADDGDILRVEVPNAPDRYDRTSYNHSHGKCLICGRVFDYKLKSEVTFDVGSNPDFTAKSYELIINGYCKKCKEDFQ